MPLHRPDPSGKGEKPSREARPCLVPGREMVRRTLVWLGCIHLPLATTQFKRHMGSGPPPLRVLPGALWAGTRVTDFVGEVSVGVRGDSPCLWHPTRTKGSGSSHAEGVDEKGPLVVGDEPSTARLRGPTSTQP